MGLISSINEGGQTTAHKVRMFRQVLRIAILCGGVVALSSFGLKLRSFPGSFFEGSLYAVKCAVADEFGISEMSIPGRVLNDADRVKRWPQQQVIEIKTDKAWPKLRIYMVAWKNIFYQEGGHALALAICTSIGCLSMFSMYGMYPEFRRGSETDILR